MTKKAAVVIGVGKTGNLTPLKAAAKGAKKVESWLLNEGYQVKCITDESEPVTKEKIENAINGFVTKPPRFHLLVVYFSGHGFWHAQSDIWLLSGAPTNVNEAINLRGTEDLARYSGIPNIVFVSDACRSIPDSRSGVFIKGINLFPNYPEIKKISDIDYFKATSEALPAYEAKINGESHSILTYALMSAYEQPQENMVLEVKEGSKTVKVVPNRQLQDYLQIKVNEILAETETPHLTQQIDVNVPSRDNVYISRIRGSVQPGTALPRQDNGSMSKLNVGGDVAEAIHETLSVQSFNFAKDEPLPVTHPETKIRVEKRIPSSSIDHFESQTGFIVYGAKIIDAKTTKGSNNAWVEILENGDGGNTPAVLRLWEVMPAVSVALQFEDGKCAIFAGLYGYIGHATIEEEGLSNISYIPSSNHWRWEMYKQKKNKIDRLRAMVSLAVKHNTFRVNSEDEASHLANEIRVEKASDPTLGLYAAHAFSQAGKEEHVLDVLNFMRLDLGMDLFDVNVLASRQMNKEPANIPIAPFCPMLTQTWNLLRPRRIELPEPLDEASPYLCDSLWTTFQPKITSRIMNAIDTGELQ